MNEIWEEITGYEGLYEVSNLGRVRSLDRYVYHEKDGTSYRKGKIIKPSVIKTPYGIHVYVELHFHGVKHKISLGKTVTEYFLPNPRGAVRFGYRDGNKENCSVENLYWKIPKRIYRKKVA